MRKRFYITTPIYYVNSVPHIGTALTTLASDVTARYRAMRGDDVTFVTGTDENGTKVMEAAQRAGKDTQAFVDEISGAFADVFTGLKIGYSDFIRTTEPRHRRAVQEVFTRLRDAGYVTLGKYEGWYDVSSETFFRESDLVDGKSPDGNEVRWVEEENWFFRLSEFEKPLLDHIEAHPEFILPEARRNEVVSFIRRGLRDASITRTNPGWGIPVPGDETKVIYVWFDALINYLAAAGWPDEGWQALWPADVEWMGKDILTRFHATLWPAMLMGLGLPLPTTLVGHAWMLMGGEKISKSKGNVVAPLDLARDLAAASGCAEDAAIDAVRYYMAATLPLENDATFTHDDFEKHYNSDLANDLGNALNRSLAMSAKFVGAVVPDAPVEPEVAAAIRAAKDGFEAAMAVYDVAAATSAAFGLVRFLNKHIDTRAPWALAKAGDPALGSVMGSILLTLRSAEGLVRPIMPGVADAIAAQLGVAPLTEWDAIGTPGSLPAGTVLSEPKPIFPRLDLKAKAAAQAAPPKPEKPKKEPPIPMEPIGIEDFAKVELRIGRVLEAVPLEGSDKLLKLDVLVGDEKRQIVAGIRKNYTPEQMIGRQVVVVFNLKPAMLRGTESQGMLLAAVDEQGGAILLRPEKEAPEGAKVR
ncbi:MAG: methionine--tRNA ligase [Fimbriimonadaceae bacterium]|nr:methionine--tRNA ligase [Fimbriimonadaceae bacterium]